jgi:SAM-dependent methyltransferase
MIRMMEAPPTRTRIARHLTGSGVEIGAGHWPFPTPEAVEHVTFVSRHRPEDERRLFPEVPTEHNFGRVDVIADIDNDGLCEFADDSQDFVIASHVLEHLAAPIAGFEEMLRVTRPGGMVIIVLPDRRFTFDKHRDGTPLSHLLEEHTAGIRDVSDEHIRDFLVKTGEPNAPTEADLALHRERSVHVHCWSDSEFDEVLTATREQLGFQFAVIDAYDAYAPHGTNIEFAYAIHVGAEQAEPIRDAKRQIYASRLVELDSLAETLRAESDSLRAANTQLQIEREAIAIELASVYLSNTWKIGTLPRNVRKRFRR